MRQGRPATAGGACRCPPTRVGTGHEGRQSADAPIAGGLIGDLARYLLATGIVLVLGVAIAAERALMAGQAAGSQLAWVLIASAALGAVFAPITAWLYGRQQ